MDVTNIRLGFATNSSSTHSVVLSGGDREIEPLTHCDAAFQFGWESFTLSHASAKGAYLAVAVWDSLNRASIPTWQKKAAMAELFGGTPIASAFRKAIETQWNEPHIDHQSAFTLPGCSTENFKAVVAEAMEFFADTRLSVHGGNDNDDSGYGGYSINSSDYDEIRLRRDGDCYVVFNYRNGAKLRLAPEGTRYEKATKPELVDLKITDQCVYGCKVCYQGSTPDGKDADSKSITEVIQALGINGLGVFEIAIGGGEPTGSANFVHAIRFARENIIVPNFTTFAVDWLLDPEKVEAANLCGGIGVSIWRKEDLRKVDKIKKATTGPHVVAQHVYGTLPAKETAELIKAALEGGYHLLMLGYKEVGFAAGKPPHDMTKVPTDHYDYLPSYRLSNTKGRISVDTAFVKKHQDFLEYVKANKLYVATQEGAFSMYVDAVTMTAHRSSYELGAPRLIQNATAKDDILSAFLSYEIAA